LHGCSLPENVAGRSHWPVRVRQRLDGTQPRDVTVSEHKWLAARFEESRPHLRAVAYRMLGSASEADDAVQEAWLKVARSGEQGVDNLGGWLTTVVARVCLDALRARKARRAASEGAHDFEPVASPSAEQAALLAESVSVALLVVLETLAPAERLAFVLHDMFDLPFDEIAAIGGTSSVAARQLASRARRRVQGASREPDPTRQRAVVDAFLTASRGGDLGALVAILDPDVVLRADRVAVEASATRQDQGAPKLAPEVRGAAAVASTFLGRARNAQPALIDGEVGMVWAPGGQPRAVFLLAIEDDWIVALEVVADPERIRQLDVVLLAPK
jgi:RNA polymerase sigma factor (sigma-70 family)